MTVSERQKVKKRGIFLIVPFGRQANEGGAILILIKAHRHRFLLKTKCKGVRIFPHNFSKAFLWV